MGPIDKPPFYALPLYAGGPNTKGGIAANAEREVLNWEGKPIPRLFTAGEISSALKFVYQGGGNLTECIVFGRIAGRNAAALKPWK
jgi:succinate dehydrogenase/fumarate reductase flavoprotein subunit